jgi:hypothetical protein
VEPPEPEEPAPDEPEEDGEAPLEPAAPLEGELEGEGELEPDEPDMPDMPDEPPAPPAAVPSASGEPAAPPVVEGEAPAALEEPPEPDEVVVGSTTAAGTAARPVAAEPLSAPAAPAGAAWAARARGGGLVRCVGWERLASDESARKGGTDGSVAECCMAWVRRNMRELRAVGMLACGTPVKSVHRARSCLLRRSPWGPRRWCRSWRRRGQPWETGGAGAQCRTGRVSEGG